MKKLFVAVLAIAGLVACNNEETVLVKGNAPIAFDSFVENATRANDPSTTTASLDAFDVWAYMDELAGTVFVGEDVTKRNGEWSYQNTQYWVPDHIYNFTAIAPMNSANWSYNQVEETIEFTNIDGSEDLLFERVVTGRVTENQPAVNLEFEHLLSKVKFTFVNGFLTDNASVKVEAVKMVAPNTGVYDIASESWTVAGSETYEFGDVAKLGMAEKAAAAEERLTIPAAAEYTVTFKATLYMGEVPAIEDHTFTVAVKNVLLEKGKAYNFVAEVNPDSFKLNAIEFDVVTVNEWVTAEQDAKVEEAELLAAAQLGGKVVLTRDLVLTKPVDVKGNLVVDLNGKTISIDRQGVETQDYVFAVFEGANLTINGEGFVKAGEANTSVAVWAYGGDVVLNGGYYTNAGEGCDLILADKGSVVTIYGGKYEAVRRQDGVAGTQERYSALNLIDNSGSSIVVYGGEFYMFNPADNASEGAHTNFVAGGYKAVADGDWYKVVVNAAERVAAGATAELTDDAVVASKFIVEGTLNGNGHTLYTAATPVDNGMIRPKGNATVKNLTIDGGNKSYFNAGTEYTLRAIYINDGGVYNFEGINTMGTGYAINVNTKQNVELTVKNSNLEGWVSYGASTTATFEGVNFSKGIYNTFRPYGNTVLTNCTFNDMVIDLQLLAEGKSVRFENCGITRDDLSGVKGHWYVCEEEAGVITVYATAQVTLTADTTEPLTISKHTVLNLNGKNIITDSDAIVVENGATLIINGNGDVKASVNGDTSANALWVKHGNVVINGGSYFVGADGQKRNDCIYIGSAAEENNAANLVSKVIINGGSFEAAQFEVSQYWVLNLRDAFYPASTFVVRGGSYKNFNPANNFSEGAGTNFVDAGYTVVKNDNWYIVK